MMSDKKFILEFLKDLKENNSKEWMDKNRSHYVHAKDCWLAEVETLLDRLSEVDIFFAKFNPKDTIFKINNNRRFQPELPVYKDYFGFSPSDPDDIFHRLHLSIGASKSFVGAGLYQPKREILNSFRHAIIENEDEFTAIIENPEFKRVGGISEDPKKLKTAPRGFPKDHKLLEILRHNSIVSQLDISDELFISNQFVDSVVDFYVQMKPLYQFIEKHV